MTYPILFWEKSCKREFSIYIHSSIYRPHRTYSTFLSILRLDIESKCDQGIQCSRTSSKKSRTLFSRKSPRYPHRRMTVDRERHERPDHILYASHRSSRISRTQVTDSRWEWIIWNRRSHILYRNNHRIFSHARSAQKNHRYDPFPSRNRRENRSKARIFFAESTSILCKKFL